MAKQVLIVDDDQNAVKYLSAVLNDHGYEALTAHDGSEGLSKAQQFKPDMMVLDVMMPKKSGFVLFGQLKKDEQLKDIPVLMLTGVAGVLEELESRSDDTFESPYDSLRESLKKAIAKMRSEGQLKPDMFIDKPVDPESFIAKVRDLIGS